MTEVKTIKGVDDETWSEFKSLAAKEKVNLGVFLKNILKEYEKSRAPFWKRIFEGEKILSEKEADDIENLIKTKRKESGFRI